MPMQNLWAKLVILCLLLPQIALGERGISPYRLYRDPDRKRDLFPIFLSLAIPGLDQWIEGQDTYATAYTALAIGGGAYAGSTWEKMDAGTFRGYSRHAALGIKLFQTAGELSVFHAFRTVVTSRKESMEYNFLKVEETPGELMFAPFRLDYLIRPTTLIPLGLTAVLFFFMSPPDGPAPFSMGNVQGNDMLFTGGFSYLAGTGEELFFRGTLMPIFNEKFRSPFMGNLISSGLFALSHVEFNKVNVPWVPFVGGLYLGWVSQYRNWTLSESIFIHTWYDILVLSSYYATRKELVIPFPKIMLTF